MKMCVLCVSAAVDPSENGGGGEGESCIREFDIWYETLKKSAVPRSGSGIILLGPPVFNRRGQGPVITAFKQWLNL